VNTDKKTRILQAAIKVFALKGYQYATIAEIAAEAGVSKGLVHVYFETKLDILMDVILLFIQSVNAKIDEKLGSLESPLEKLHAVFDAIREIMSISNKELYWGHILKEGLPATDALKDERLREKFSRIGPQVLQMRKTLDTIITDGQRQGLIDTSLKPQVIRQMLGGASQMLFQGLAMQSHGRSMAGYDEADVGQALHKLIDKFTLNKPARKQAANKKP
jgi:AcrR family transcriptional regulator